MRIIGLALMALLTFITAAQAQVAAPRLNPLPFTPSAAWNPAVYSWDGPSRIGAGLGEIALDFTASGSATVEAAAGDTTAATLRWVGESFAFGVDYFLLNLDIIQSFGGGPIEFETTLVGASFQMDDLFSIGAGQETGKNLFDTSLTTGSLPIVGATLRLGEVFYFGFATGDETIEQETTTVAGSAVEGERGVTRIGLAYHSRDGENGLHVEVWRNDIDAINTTALSVDGEESTGVTLEVVFSNILIGYESASGETLDAANGSVLEEDDSTTISLGWVPMEGLSLVVSMTEIESNDLSNGEVFQFNLLFAGVTWSF